MIRRPPRSTLSSSSAASDVYKRQLDALHGGAVAQQLVAIALELLWRMGELVVEHPPDGAVIPVEEDEAIDAQQLAGVAERHLVAAPAQALAAIETRALVMADDGRGDRAH